MSGDYTAITTRNKVPQADGIFKYLIAEPYIAVQKRCVD